MPKKRKHYRWRHADPKNRPTYIKDEDWPFDPPSLDIISDKEREAKKQRDAIRESEDD